MPSAITFQKEIPTMTHSPAFFAIFFADLGLRYVGIQKEGRNGDLLLVNDLSLNPPRTYALSLSDLINHQFSREFVLSEIQRRRTQNGEVQEELEYRASFRKELIECITNLVHESRQTSTS
jgi:hypothetical protein